MDTAALTLVTSTIAAGAVAALKDTASATVKDAYAGVKALIRRKYSVDLTDLELKPDSDINRVSLAEKLSEAGAEGDGELLKLAQVLAAVLTRHAPTVGAVVGVNLEKVRAGFVRIDEVASEQLGVNIREAEFAGGIEIGSVKAGQAKPQTDEEVENRMGPR